jgi:hypothetical protein
MEASEIKIIARKCEIFKTLNDEELDLLLFQGEEKGFDLSNGLPGCLLLGGQHRRAISPVLHVWKRIDVLPVLLYRIMEVGTSASA